MPEILAPGTGLSPLTDRSIMPFNNVHTIQDVLEGDPYKVPGGGGFWSDTKGESHKPGSYKPNIENYKRKERDLDILMRMMDEKEKENADRGKWIVKVEGGAITFPSERAALRYVREAKKRNIPVLWFRKLAQTKEMSKVEAVEFSLARTARVDSIDPIANIKETGTCFSIGQNLFMTCAHVVKKYNKLIDTNLQDKIQNIEVYVVKNNIRQRAKVLSIDGAKDIALLEAEINMPYLDLAFDPMVGEDIIAVGSPHGFDNNASFGTIGSLGQKVFDIEGSPEYMFVDASIFHGNSGGPIIRLKDGRVLGMVSAIISKSGEYGLNMGIPSVYLKNFMNKGE